MARRGGVSPKRTPGFLGRALGRLRHWFGSPKGPSPHRESRRLAPLLQLEERRLLSVTPVGSEFRVNTYTTGPQQTYSGGPYQSTPAVAMDAQGNYVVTWSSQNQDGSGWG